MASSSSPWRMRMFMMMMMFMCMVQSISSSTSTSIEKEVETLLLSMFGKEEEKELEVIIRLIREHPIAQVFKMYNDNDELKMIKNTIQSEFPTALTHGMGDACENPGFSSLTKDVAQRTGNKARCITSYGSSLVEDTIYGFLANLNNQTEHFAKMIKSDPSFAKGFNAIGLSQGNLVIRAYIHRYNNPPVKNWISIHGPLLGVASIPRCDPDFFTNPITAKICEMITNVAGEFAYTSAIQTNLAQSNMLRDPFELEAYKAQNIFLPDINNEKKGQKINEDYKSRFASLNKLTAVRALRDTMIQPSLSEWFGFFADKSWTKLLTMKETEFYKNNLFGLKSLDEKNRITFLTTRGDHLDFSLNDLYQWIDSTFLNNPSPEIASF